MTEHTDYLISGPSFEAKFSLVDQVTPPIYSRRVLIFSRQLNDDQESAVLALRSGLERTVNEIPVLAGQMGLDASGWTLKNGQARLRVKNVDMDFSELQETGFSEEMLPADLISSVPGLVDPQSEWHACRIQANFIRGGLLMVMSIMHTTMDGLGITRVIESLARNCRGADADVPSATTKYHSLDRSALSTCNGDANVERLDCYSIVTGTPNFPPITSQIITTTFQLPVSALKALKTAASPSEGFITTHDAVNALCWRTHAQGRHDAKLITDTDIARFAFPVEFRKIVNPPLSLNYIGNAVLMTKVELPVRTLLGPDGLIAAAVAIRAGIKKVDASYVDNFIAVAKSLDKPGQLKINLKLSQPDTAFGSTSYKSFDHSGLDWDAAVGKYERMRLSHGVTGEGMSVIMPVLRDGSWEVTITIVGKLLGAFRADEEWCRYTATG